MHGHAACILSARPCPPRGETQLRTALLRVHRALLSSADTTPVVIRGTLAFRFRLLRTRSGSRRQDAERPAYLCPPGCARVFHLPARRNGCLFVIESVWDDLRVRRRREHVHVKASCLRAEMDLRSSAACSTSAA